MDQSFKNNNPHTRSHICSVCEEESIPGSSFRMHYNVYCCEACKCFFRRSIQLNKIFSCKFFHKCIVSHKVSRQFCKACRLRKCIQVGMKKDAVRLKHSKKSQTLLFEPNSIYNDKYIFPKGLQSGNIDIEIGKTPNALAHKTTNIVTDCSFQNDSVVSPNNDQILLSYDESYDSYRNNIFVKQNIYPSRDPIKSISIDCDSSKAYHNNLLSESIHGQIACIEPSKQHSITEGFLKTTFSTLQDIDKCIFQSPLQKNIHYSTESYLKNPKPHNIYDQSSDIIPKISEDLLSSNQYETASIEEVLDSLKSRILDLFKWSKKSLEFCKLSQNDQKSLLRYTVVELVMLGFARASIHYDNALYFNHIDKIIKPYHPTSAVACVTKLTIEKLVVPLRFLNLNRCEYRIMKEIILYNADSTGLECKQLVRAMRRVRFEQLFLATCNCVGRFGEILSLLTPLFEVATEITDQLRLEQYVQESEATMDAFLLISLLHEVEEFDS
ncbi:Nuclear hormone receptor [Oopsacas minuta]|uniref:Nuclear hormone receptor n=1 Tax=Oopsacas minuta TaxID=111878 RepID=A0AAV7JII9_9METZ|nr:Nuclear hormone receptor [Oopsacas minuta]